MLDPASVFCTIWSLMQCAAFDTMGVIGPSRLGRGWPVSQSRSRIPKADSKRIQRCSCSELALCPQTVSSARLESRPRSEWRQCGLRMQHCNQRLDGGFGPSLPKSGMYTGRHATTDLKAVVSPFFQMLWCASMAGLGIASKWVFKLCTADTSCSGLQGRTAALEYLTEGRPTFRPRLQVRHPIPVREDPGVICLIYPAIYPA